MPVVELIAITAVLSALVVVALVTRRRWLGRVARLNISLADLAERYHLRAELPDSPSDDELHALEETVNRMFAALDEKERKLREREDLFRTLAESVDESIIVHRDKIIYVNPKAAQRRGLRQEDLIDFPVTDLIHADHREEMRIRLSSYLSGEAEIERCEFRMLDRAGAGYWVEASAVLIDYQGAPALLTAAVDITHRKRVEAELVAAKERAQKTLDAIGEGVITTDKDGLIDYLNSAAQGLLGWRREQALGKSLGQLVGLVDEADRKPLADPVKLCLQEGRRVDLGRRALLLADNGKKEYSIELTVSPLRDASAETMGSVIVMHDVTELRGLARQMSYQASHDALTGLYNRREFECRLEEALQVAHAGSAGHVVCYLDLDRFKVVNDTCGHIAGDNMLREVATLIKDQVRDSDIVGRLGGDEFGMLLLGCPLQKARQIAEDSCTAVKDYRFVWRDRIFDIGVSIGLVEIGLESGSVVDALSAADSACYIAKQQGRSQVHVYSARDEARARHRGEIKWLQRLQRSIKDSSFDLLAQPIVPLSGHADSGPAFEVLLRMRGEGGESIAPAEFLRAAERYHLMPNIDRWVVQTAFSAVASGALRLPPGRSCAINLSGQTLGDARFLEFVVDCLDRTGLTPDQVCFEVTESSVVSNVNHAGRFIGVLHGMGCQFALDDFGSGLGSLANLKSLAMDFMKIDGSFIRDLHSDPVSRAMVSAMMNLARTLDIRIVAEEVETQEALDAVRELGVDFAQGFAIGKPRALPHMQTDNHNVA